MIKQAQSSLDLYRGQNPVTIKQALRMQKNSVVKELQEYFNAKDINELYKTFYWTMTKPIPSKFIEEFLLRAQHHSGLPLLNLISCIYIEWLNNIDIVEDLLPTLMDDLLNHYMTVVHKIYHENKAWKSYDW